MNFDGRPSHYGISVGLHLLPQAQGLQRDCGRLGGRGLPQYRHRTSEKDGFNLVAYIMRGDPAAVLRKEAMTDSEIRAFKKDHPEHVQEGGQLAYTILNAMFTPDSPAMTLITTGAKSGSIARGDGLSSFQALHAHFNAGTDKVLGVIKSVEDLRSLRMKDGESAAINGALLRKDPPVVIPDALLMPMLVKGLSDSYKEVKKQQARGGYGVDMKTLVDAISGKGYYHLCWRIG